MTPFQEDLIDLFEYYKDVYLKSFCYFFGHKWSEWKLAYNSSINEIRQCKRCAAFDHR